MQVIGRILMVSLIASGILFVPASASAAVNNGGCPPDNSNWTLVTDFRAQFDKQLEAALDAGWTVEQIAAFIGVDPTVDALWEFYSAEVTQADKNVDGALCYADRWGVTKKLPFADSVIDNVLPV